MSVRAAPGLPLWVDAVVIHRAVPDPPPVRSSRRPGPPAKNDPKCMRWALVEAAADAARRPACRDRNVPTKRRLGRQRGSKVARVGIARELGGDREMSTARPSKEMLMEHQWALTALLHR